MNTNHDTEISTDNHSSFTRACLAQCETLLAEIQSARDAIATEFRETFEANERLFQLAMNEAEALAWQTAYPHLVFPALAAEKAQSVAAWHTRQQSLWHVDSRLPLAA